MSQCSLKKNLKKCEPDDTLYPIHNNKPDEVHWLTIYEPDLRLSKNNNKPDEVHWLTIYEPDLRLSKNNNGWIRVPKVA